MILPPPETVTVASPGFSLEAATLSTLSTADVDFLSPVVGSIWKFLMVSSTDLRPSSGRNDLWVKWNIQWLRVKVNIQKISVIKKSKYFVKSATWALGWAMQLLQTQDRLTHLDAIKEYERYET